MTVVQEHQVGFGLSHVTNKLVVLESSTSRFCSREATVCKLFECRYFDSIKLLYDSRPKTLLTTRSRLRAGQSRLGLHPKFSLADRNTEHDNANLVASFSLSKIQLSYEAQRLLMER